MYDYREISNDLIEYFQVAGVDDLENGERLYVEIGELELVIFNIAGEIFAIGDVCSHDGAPLGEGELEDHDVICPRHGARFDIRSGKATGLPAVVDIPAYPVRIRDGQIEVGIQKSE